MRGPAQHRPDATEQLAGIERLRQIIIGTELETNNAVNILAANQKSLAERFATKDVDRWADVAFIEGVGGAPRG